MMGDGSPVAGAGGSADVLGGARIVVTADRRAAELSGALERRGAVVAIAPALSIVPHVDDAALLAATRAVIDHAPDVVVVTTGVGFRGWVEAADAAGMGDDLVATLRSARIVARGPKARGAIQAAGLVADWVAESETSAELRAFLLAEGVVGLRIAIQHHGAGSDGLDDDLAAAGAQVVPLVVYRWGPSPDPAAVERSLRDVAAERIDAIVFTSAPAATAYLATATELGLRDELVAACRPGGSTLVAAVGPVTAAPLRAAGIEPAVPDRYRLGALVRELVTRLSVQEGLTLDTAGGRVVVHRRTAALDGRVLPLSPTGLAVLRRLALAGGAVVPRAELRRVLPAAGSDHAVEVAVARLREAIGVADVVDTVIKRGYRLGVPVGDVRRDDVRRDDVRREDVRRDDIPVGERGGTEARA